MTQHAFIAMKKIYPPYRDERGIALLLVLWIVTLLAVICAEFSVTMRTEAVVAHNFRETEQAYYAAESGINRAVVEMMRTAAQPAASRTAAATDITSGDMAPEEQAEFEYWAPGGSYSIDIDDFRCRVEIEDESNKIAINKFLEEAKKNPELLKQILRNKIGLEGEDVDIVADSMIDWRDSDSNITGANGAEDDYYEKLDPPYLCRNGDLPVIEELLLVRGVDEQILFGRRGRPEQKIELSPEDLEDILSGRPLPEQLLQEIELPDADDDEASIQYLGLLDIFSAPPADFGSGAKVNEKGDIILDINTATASQLLLLRGMTPLTAAEIVEERRRRPFAAKEDRLPTFENYFRWQDSITVGSKSSFNNKMLRINARGCSPDGLVCRTITCTLLISRSYFFFLSWRERN